MSNDFVQDVAWPVSIEALPLGQQPPPTKPKEKRKRRRFREIPLWPWPLLCLLCLLLCVLGLLAALIATLIALKGAAIPIANATNDTYIEATKAVVRVTPVVAATTTTTPLPPTTTTTLTTTLTTTVAPTTTTIVCGPSCLNQSWTDHSDALAQWPLDGSYADQTGVYNGMLSPNLPTFGTGYLGQAAIFDAAAQQAIYTLFIPLNNASFTVEAWIKPTGYPNYLDHSIVGLCPSKIRNRCLHLNIRSRKLYFGFYYDDLRGDSIISLNQWIHVAFVFDLATRQQTIYLNGLADGQVTASDALHIDSANFTIGVNEGVNYPDSFFQGYIDNLLIFEHAKSACEILERATLAAYFKFDTAARYSDSGPNGVVAAVSSASIVSGHKNQAIFLSGSPSSYFQTWGLTSFGISNQPFSISFWMQPQSRTGTLVHLSTSSSGTGPVCFSLLGFSSTGAIVAQVLTSIDTVVATTDPTLSSSSSWIFVVQTWSPSSGMKLYVDNVLVSNVAVSPFLASETTPNYLTLGNCLDGCAECPKGSIGNPGPFMGSIDDWHVFNRELTSDDVCALYFAN